MNLENIDEKNIIMLELLRTTKFRDVWFFSTWYFTGTGFRTQDVPVLLNLFCTKTDIGLVC
jgi:hypothetical protein